MRKSSKAGFLLYEAKRSSQMRTERNAPYLIEELIGSALDSLGNNPKNHPKKKSLRRLRVSTASDV